MNEHVRVDLVYSSVFDRARLWIDALGFSLFFLPVTLYLTWLSVPFAQQSVVSQGDAFQLCRRPDTMANQAYGADRLCTVDASRDLWNSSSGLRRSKAT